MSAAPKSYILIVGEETKHFEVADIPRLIAELRRLLAEHQPWLSYSDRTGGKDTPFACCRCKATTYRPGQDGWRWRPILPELRERAPRAPRYESLCRACFEAAT